MKRAGVYLRVSTTEQADSRLGLDSQSALSVEALRREDREISSEGFIDAGVSGSVPLMARKEGRRLIAAIEAGEIGMVVALNQDRLFRSMLDALVTLTRWDELGVRVLFVDGGFMDFSDDDKWFKMGIDALLAEREVRMVRKRTKRALSAARDRGVKLGGVPFGYRTAAKVVDGRKVNGGVHVAVDVEQRVIDQVRSLRVTAGRVRTFREIAEELNRMGVPSPRGKRWHGEQARRVIGRTTS